MEQTARRATCDILAGGYGFMRRRRTSSLPVRKEAGRAWV